MSIWTRLAQLMGRSSNTADDEQHVVDRLQALRLAPGETLIITTDRALTREQADAVQALAKRDLADDARVLVLAHGLKVAGVRRTSDQMAEVLVQLRTMNRHLDSLAYRAPAGSFS